MGSQSRSAKKMAEHMRDHAKMKYELAEIRRESQSQLQQMDTAASATTLVHFSGSLGECGVSFGFVN